MNNMERMKKMDEITSSANTNVVNNNNIENNNEKLISPIPIPLPSPPIRGKRNTITAAAATASPNKQQHKNEDTKSINANTKGLLKITKGKTKIPRIPFREKSTVSLVPPDNKRFLLRKKSKTNLDFQLKLKDNNVCNEMASAKSTPRTIAVTSRTISSTTVSPRQRITGGDNSAISRRNDKNFANETAFNAKQKQFNMLKRRVTELQSELVRTFKTLKEMQTKVKIAGKEKVPEEIKLITLIKNHSGEILIKNPEEMHDICLYISSRSPRSLFSFDSSEMIEIKSKLFTITEVGFKLTEEILNNLRSIPTNDIDTKEAGDNKDGLRKYINEIMNSFEIKILTGLKQQQIRLNSTLKEMEKFTIPQITDADILKIRKDYEQKIEQLSQHNEELKKNLEISEAKVNDMQSLEATESKELKREILASKQNNMEKDNEITKLKNSLKDYEEKIKDFENQLKSIQKINDEKVLLAKKLEDELQSRDESVRMKYNAIEEHSKHQQEIILEQIQKQREYQKQLEIEKVTRSKLEDDIQERNAEIQNLKSELDKLKFVNSCAAGDRQNLETALLSDLKKADAKYEKLQKIKDAIEKERDELRKISHEKDELQLEFCKSSQEINQLQTTNEWLRNTVERLEKTITKKNDLIRELEQKLSSGAHLKETNREILDELNKLREIEKQKQKEIDTLKKQLSKDQITLKQQQETIFMNQRLLKIRCELINSLQEKEQVNNSRLADLSPEFKKNATIIDQMNHELSAKTEELQNLFSTLGTKQLELAKQKHLIKVLENTNEQLRKIRVKQQVRITKQDQEIRQLKEILKVSNIKFGISEEGISN